MKKFMVLSLVLAMVGISSAALTFVADGNVAKVVSDNANPYAFWVVVENDLLPVSIEFTAGGNTNGDSTMTGYGDFGGTDWTYVAVRSLAPANPLVAGDHVTVTLADGIQLGYEDMGMGKIDFVTEDESTVLGSLYVVPEPATLALLGLGALVLRRKK